jgi:plastocyanin
MDRQTTRRTLSLDKEIPVRISSRWLSRLHTLGVTLGVLALLAGALVLAGCGSSTATNAVPTATTAPTVAPTVAPTSTTSAPTNTPSGSQAAVSVLGGYGGFSFSPSVLTIKVGTTVTWTNNTSAPHTVTSDTGAFNGSLGRSGATFSFTFTRAGTFSYHCSIHPYMKATITVTM